MTIDAVRVGRRRPGRRRRRRKVPRQLRRRELRRARLRQDRPFQVSSCPFIHFQYRPGTGEDVRGTVKSMRYIFFIR